jgi:dephospho-CoA kinase
MKIIGLIGGIASGKSHVSHCLHKLGAGIIDVDEIGHEVIEIPEIADQMAMRWGSRFEPLETCVVAPDPHLTYRAQIGKIVFNCAADLKFLEDITWPEIKRIIDRKISLYHPEHTQALVIDFPMLIETGMDKQCDQLWLVDCPYEQRVKNFYLRRMAARSDLDEKASQERHRICEQKQVPLATKRLMAHATIVNDMTQNVEQQVLKAWGVLFPGTVCLHDGKLVETNGHYW